MIKFLYKFIPSLIVYSIMITIVDQLLRMNFNNKDYYYGVAIVFIICFYRTSKNR